MGDDSDSDDELVNLLALIDAEDEIVPLILLGLEDSLPERALEAAWEYLRPKERQKRRLQAHPRTGYIKDAMDRLWGATGIELESDKYYEYFSMTKALFYELFDKIEGKYFWPLHA